MRKRLEIQVKELQVRLEEAEGNALKASKKQVAKQEGRVREMECRLDDEARRHADDQKNLRKCERCIKELTFQSDEDKRTVQYDQLVQWYEMAHENTASIQHQHLESSRSELDNEQTLIEENDQLMQWYEMAHENTASIQHQHLDSLRSELENEQTLIE